MSEFITDEKVGALAIADLMAGKKTIVVAGAGMSTDAGIPDYRGTGSSGMPTVDMNQFLSELYWRKWVWRRNQETWKTVARLQPTPGHRALARLEDAGLVNCIATQNVDGLDRKAGCKNVQLLHGSFEEVQCLGCAAVFSREYIDHHLRKLNPDVKDDPDSQNVAVLAAADEQAARACQFNLLSCPRCGGIIKPGIVFFGESLPGQAIERSFAAAREADVVLAVGTSLAVLTGLWVLREAWGTGAKVAVINRGATAADSLADVRVSGGSSQVLELIASQLLD